MIFGLVPVTNTVQHQYLQHQLKPFMDDARLIGIILQNLVIEKDKQ